MASRRLVLPWPLAPATTVRRGAGSRSRRSRLRRSRMRRRSRQSFARAAMPRSNAHGHDDGDVALLARLAAGAEHGGIELARDAEDHLLVVDGGEDVEEV